MLSRVARGLRPAPRHYSTRRPIVGGNWKCNPVDIIPILKGLEDKSRVVIAYEPVWAIGTGKVCPCDVAQQVHKTIRDYLAELYDRQTADAVRIQYGGSVTPESVDELMAQPDIDGCLVGGASLDGEKFGRILNFN